MTNQPYVERLGFTQDDLERRLQFFRIEDADVERLRSLAPWAEEHTATIVEAFYEHLMAHEETRDFLADPQVVRRLKSAQTRYFLTMFNAVFDLDYVENRLRIGGVHERLGVPPRWYIGAYGRYLRLAHRSLIESGRDAPLEDYSSLEKVMHFDAALAIDAYVTSYVDTATRQQASIRELSTPVIRVHDRVLLMPIVGTVDSLRAQQIMQTVLDGIAVEKARVLILDIAGVPVVDTQVADYLLKTTAAVRLLGADTILTGISPQVARTVVELGVDISAMYTRNRLSDGVDLALAITGRQIVERPS